MFKRQTIIYSISNCKVEGTEGPTVKRVRSMPKRRESSLASDQDRDLWFVPGLPTHQHEPHAWHRNGHFLPAHPELICSDGSFPLWLHLWSPYPIPNPISPAPMSLNYDSFSENTTLLAWLSLSCDDSPVAPTDLVPGSQGLVAISYKAPTHHLLLLVHTLTRFPASC